MLPTNECNVACDYCFEDKTRDVLSRAQLSVVANKVLDHIESRTLDARRARLVRDDDCFTCDYLSICHGGCPVRAYSITGKFLAKDPYCAVYKAMFSRLEAHAIRRRGCGAVA